MKIHYYLLLTLTLLCQLNASAQPIIIDHNSTDITKLPQFAIEAAKSKLIIAYGHTSHGSQLTSGMSSLVDFANSGGKGLDLPHNIFAFSSDGSNNSLHLRDAVLGGDVGYWPTWYNNTINYLNDNPEINVIIWSWCGQLSWYSQAQLFEQYLEPMTNLENTYPHIKFVYMTGHSDGSGFDGNLHIRNQQIRQYCIDNDKILYDFYDIECYDPDSNYYGDKFVTDNCDYTLNGTSHNWATDWQNSHTQDYDWFDCYSAHSLPLNANQKAYAAWWLWCSLAGWNPAQLSSDIVPDNQVNMLDFAAIANSWLTTDSPFNITGSTNLIDTEDLTTMAQQWLTTP